MSDTEINPDSPKADLLSRACIERLVDAFYERVGRDELLGFIFNDIAAVDWAHHLPKMYAFWETVLFRSGGYQGSPLAMHQALARHTPLGREQFERWLGLFCETVDGLFEGSNAGHIKRCAADMASVIHRKVNQLPDFVEAIQPREETSAGASGAG